MQDPLILRIKQNSNVKLSKLFCKIIDSIKNTNKIVAAKDSKTGMQFLSETAKIMKDNANNNSNLVSELCFHNKNHIDQLSKDLFD